MAKILLRLFPCATGLGESVPERYLSGCWNVPRSAYDDHVSNKAAASIVVAAVVNVGGFDEDSSGVMMFLSLLLLGRLVAKMGFQGASRAAENIEGDDCLG